MSWIKIDDQFADHPKIVEAGPSAAWLFICGLCYAGRYLTDGFVTEKQVPKMTDEDDPIGLAGILVSVGLWHKVDGGYQIHDYLQYNPSRADVEAQRQIVRRRQAMNANPQLMHAVRQRDGNTCRYCGCFVNWQDRKGSKGGTYDHIIPISRGGEETPENIVVCCKRCNSSKGARTPDEAGMPLLPAQNQAGTKPEPSRNSDNPYPSPSIPTVADKPAMPPKKSEDPKPDQPKKQMMTMFLKVTRLEMPALKSDIGFWWSQMGQILAIANKDPIVGMRLIEETVSQMKQDQLTISSPKSLLNVARAIAAKRRRCEPAEIRPGAREVMPL